MSTPRYADLTWDQIKASPAWEGLSIEGRVQLANDYHADVAGYLQESGEATDESLAKVNAARRARIFEVAPSLKQPEDIGVMENVSNAFTKSMSSFKENIYYNLLEQNPEEAARYRTALEREYPTAPGFSEKVGRITGMMLPSGAALLSAPITGPLGLTGAAAIATGALYGASSAGAAYGNIYAHEQATGEDVSSGKTAAVMAGHAAFEMASETLGLYINIGVARRIGGSIGSQNAQRLGEAILAGNRGQTARQMADAVGDYFTHNRAARFGLGWVGMGAVEGIEEVAAQIGQNFTDKLYRESPLFDGLIQTFEEGALGGLLLGPLAIGVQAGQASRVRESMYQQSKVLLNETLMAEARRKGGKDEVAVGALYDELSSTLTPERVDPTAFSNPDFMMLKEAFGMSGVELVPVLGTPKMKGKGVRLVAKDGTPVAMVDMNRVKGNAAVMEFTAAHEMLHGLETVLGKQGSIELAREMASTIPEFSKYKETLDAAYRAQQMGETTQDYAISEITADIFGPTFFKPQFQRAAIKLAAENPAIGREVVARLKDMRSRFERMGRRVDAYLAMTPEQQDAAGNVIQLPNVAMQAAKAKIDDTTTYLDRITGNFVKGFGEALALKEKTEAQAKVQGDDGEEDLVTGETVAPLSVAEGASDIPLDALGRPEPRATISVFGTNWGKLREEAWFSMSTPSNFKNRIRLPVNQDNLMAVFDEAVAQAKAMGYEAVLGKDMEGFPQARLTHTKAKQLEEADAAAESTKWAGAKPVYLRFGKPPASGYSTDYSSGTREKGVSVYRGQMLPSGKCVRSWRPTRTSARCSSAVWLTGEFMSSKVKRLEPGQTGSQSLKLLRSRHRGKPLGPFSVVLSSPSSNPSPPRKSSPAPSTRRTPSSRSPRRVKHSKLSGTTRPARLGSWTRSSGKPASPRRRRLRTSPPPPTACAKPTTPCPHG